VQKPATQKDTPNALSDPASQPAIEGRQRRLRIAVFVDHAPDQGGGFQQALSTVEALLRSQAIEHEFVVFARFEPARRRLLEYGIESILYKHGWQRLTDRWSASILGGAILRRLHRLGLRRLGRHLDALLDHHHIDLAFLTGSTDTALRIGDHPFIVTVWDLDQIDHPDFPEVYGERVFEQVDRRLRATLPRATAVSTTSSSLARRIANIYQVEFDRIVVLPLLVPLAARRHAAGKGSITVKQVQDKYCLPERYIFYPAFFSHHKNHLYLLEALLELKHRHGIILHAVFCGGGAPGDQKKVERQVEAIGLKERVRFLGLVPDDDIPALYQAALALVMPSYFGPNNLPPLEAAALGCPVICSDLGGCREQMGEAALYCDLADPSSLADHLATLVEDSGLRERLRSAGLQLAVEIGKIDYAQTLTPVLDRYAYLCRRWKWPEKI
jgi:glycosyltransferase involved in cell wall biosynthesis